MCKDDSTYIFIDVSKKQSFIYKNNKLKDNVYNSVIIKAITETLEEENIKDLYIKFKKEIISLKYELDELKKEGKIIETMYSGGGNSIIKFEDEKTAIQFIENYSLKIYEKFPQLELYISYVKGSEFDMDEEKIHEELHKRADKLKDARRGQIKRLTYGVEQIDELGYPKQNSSEKKCVKEAKNFLQSKLKNDLNEKNIEFTYELESYKKNNKPFKEDNTVNKNYMGVIAIDGNKMGELVNAIKTMDKEKSYYYYLKQMSKEISKVYYESVKNAILTVAKKRNGIIITPIVLAGDDICLITQGTIAIELAAEIINQLHIRSDTSKLDKESILKKLMENKNIKNLTAAAGICIVKPGYPFFESIKIAESRQSSGKTSMHQIKTIETDQDNKTDGLRVANVSMIDWEIVKGSNKEEIDYLEYISEGSKLKTYHIKPLWITTQRYKGNKFYNEGTFLYEGFKNIVEKIQEMKKKEEISSSELQNIKNAMYSGEKQYELVFDMQKTTGIKNLETMINQELNQENSSVEKRYCIFNKQCQEDEKKNESIYILNDIIDVLDFMEPVKMGGAE
ncbi:Cas10/Cmr2 second palm domain-containing protein [Anaerophilus nitritogenes]|uniref:Cas10/Cmr2 second palm domain-containing protein n=1 Tax=Anaerophilus nitritogenes TaxID=2498136 RepID=UPI00101CEE9A|nr:hypothetical protein [Anaerophilus nitritogenes]